MRTVLVVGAGRLQVPAFQGARRLGLRTVAVDRDPAAPGMALADASFPVDTSDVEGILEVARAERVAGVVTLCTDYPVRAVAAVAAALGLPGLSVEAAAAATDKALMREAFARAGAPCPGFRRVRTPAEARAAVAALGLPAIAKPTTASGSRGIRKIGALEEVEAAFAHALAATRTGEVLLEEFVEGPEVSVESLWAGGRHRVVAVTDKATTGDPHWVETGHAQPSRLPPGDLEAIAAAAVAGLEALGVRHAAGHSELKLGPRGPRIMEIGARLGGDFITTELVPRTTGVDMVEGILHMALGEEPVVRPTRRRAAAIRYLAAEPGRVAAVEGVGAALALPGVARLEVDVRPGDVVRAVRSSGDRPGFVICEGGTAAEAEARALEAARAVVIRTSPALDGPAGSGGV